MTATSLLEAVRGPSTRVEDQPMTDPMAEAMTGAATGTGGAATRRASGRGPVDEDVPDADEQARRTFAEDFGLLWESIGSSLMDGRILGYLMVMRPPYISSAGLAATLAASAGSVSMSTRRLVESGFAKRQVVPGDRSHYFRVEQDVWGSWLAGERRYLDMERQVIERGLELFADDPADEVVRQRLVNGRDYLRWVATYHRRMLADWEEFKRARDAGEHGPDAAGPGTGETGAGDDRTWEVSR